ncbi:S-layer homology domain-containing protein [Paenibacillus sp. PAMC21692]|uniref:S-layer homology domain-containing protein n=1 Tax=Paenibacillus sp. PAMC21692 TaxID=2762320 RepID=UPI00164E07BA|nr:S-layer homology domain-containing protein [Paenibacillus sp. PAMC21692]QNK58341.1 S-layer homology domain-containing protein [Paenibacillus sp. PAMC21692]
MKKSLSLLVAIAMVFSMFATVVSAAEEQQPTAGEYLNELGVILGNQDGDLKEDQTWKRQDIVVLLSRLFGAEDEAKGAEKTHEFKDVTDKNYDGYISWAVEEGLVKGKSATVFGFGDELENRDFYLLVLRALGQEVEYDKVGGAALEAGLAPEDTDFDAIPLRGETYTAIVAALKTPVGENGETLEELLGLVEAAAITSTQTGVKQITVKFNRAVDESKAKFEVKNNAAKRDVAKTTYSEDKKTVVLDLAAKLLDGASTVTVSGVSEKDLVADFTAQAEKVTDIKFLSDKLALGSLPAAPGSLPQPDNSKVSTAYQIVNQFGEDVTKSSGGSLTFHIGKPGATGTGNNGVLAVNGNGSATFTFGETIHVTAILNLGTYGVTANQAFTVGQQAVVDSVEIDSVYHPENKELNTASNFPDFVLLLDAKDQYGNKVNAAALKAGAFALTSNPTLFTLDIATALDAQGPNNDKLGIKLIAPNTGSMSFDGTNKVTVTTLFGQKSDSIDVVVKKAATLTTFTLNQPEEIVAAGDGTVKIPFSAYDQNGNALTKWSDVNTAKVNVNGALLKQNYLTKNAEIEWTVPTTPGVYFISSTVVGTPNVSQLQISVQAEAKADAVTGFDKVSNALVVGGTVEIKAENIIVKDQHGRNMKVADLLTDGFKVELSAQNPLAGVVTGFDTLETGTTSVTLTATKKGSEQVKVVLKNSTGGVVSEYAGFTFNVIDSGAIQADSYVVETPEKISVQEAAPVTGISTHDVAVKVTGKKSDGTVVTLPSNAYTLTAVAPLKVVDGKLNASASTLAENKTETGKYIVTILATGEQISKEIVITTEALLPTTFEAKDAGVLTAADLVVKGASANLTIANVFATIKAKDQFGVALPALAAADYTATVSELDGLVVGDITGNGQTANNVTVNVGSIAAGDSYSVTFTSIKNGKSVKVKVVATS